MDSKKYQVFISSTYKDLVQERESIIKAILEMYHIPIGMEMFSAEDEEQWEIIRRTIDVSDYYILILGLRYGSKTSDEISFTQKEYEYALEKKIPILAFVMDESAPLPRDKRDDDLTDINKFRQMVLENSKMAQFWETKDQLIKNVSISLMKQIFQRPGIGWVRGDKLGTEEALSEELTNLSRENRKLREQIADLQSKVSIKTPSINVKLDPVEFNLVGCDFKPTPMPRKFDENDCPENLIMFLEQQEIAEYNNQLPTIEELERYNNDQQKAHYIRNFSLPLSVYIANNGSCKANNIYVEMTFPDEVFVYKVDDELEEPKNIIPISPAAKAQQRYDDANNPYGLSMYQPFNLADLERISNVIRPITSLDKSYWTSLEGNKLTIRLNNLMHTRQRLFDKEYVVAPLKSGTHTVEVKIICEEYDKQLQGEINITVQ